MYKLSLADIGNFEPKAIYEHEDGLLNIQTRDCSINIHQLAKFRETDILLDNHPRDGVDEFVGFNLWINASYVLSKHYEEYFGCFYPLIRFVHNKIKRRIKAKKVIVLVTTPYPDIIEHWGDWREQIETTLKDYSLRVHIPL